MNTFTAIVNLTADPEALKMGERDTMKLRVADNTFGKNNEARFFDVIVSSGPDMDVAKRLRKGDQIVVTGTLTKSSYKAKKPGKHVKKGQSVSTDSMPFGRILQVTKSPTFFGLISQSTENEDEADEGSTDEPDLGTYNDEGTDEPLEGVV